MTHCVWNNTSVYKGTLSRVLFALIVGKKFPSVKFFTLAPLLMLGTNMRCVRRQCQPIPRRRKKQFCLSAIHVPGPLYPREPVLPISQRGTKGSVARDPLVKNCKKNVWRDLFDATLDWKLTDRIWKWGSINYLESGNQYWADSRYSGNMLCQLRYSRYFKIFRQHVMQASR